jgi:hypothetical protein
MFVPHPTSNNAYAETTQRLLVLRPTLRIIRSANAKGRRRRW